MQVTITGRNFEVTPSIKEHLIQRISKLEKYCPRLVQAHAILCVEKYRHIAELTIAAKNFKIAGKEETEDMYASIDKITHTMENRLKRHREKIKDHKLKGNNEKIVPLFDLDI